MSARIFLTTTIIRLTFIPPPVLPAQAPKTIRSNKIIFEKVGHKLKSQEEYPVVVIMEDTWKKAKRTASMNPP